MDDTWPFADPPNTAVVTVRQVLDNTEAICHVTHDTDGMWQFLTGSTVSEEDAKIVALSEIASHDPTVLGLASLPIGSFAWRHDARSEWQIEP